MINEVRTEAAQCALEHPGGNTIEEPLSDSAMSLHSNSCEEEDDCFLKVYVNTMRAVALLVAFAG